MRELYLDNDHEIVRDMTEWDVATGEHEARSGLTLTGFISATSGGTAIHASLSKSPLDEVGSTGRYHKAVAGTDLRTHLLSYVGKTVFERVTGAGYADNEPMLVLATRPAGM